MKILIPNETITITSTNVAETDYPQWAVGTTYALGGRVIVLAEHMIYESLASANTGNTPSTSPDKWIAVSKTNAYKCIDDKVSTQTINNTSIVMTLPVGKAVSIAFLNVECSSIRVELYDGALQIYDETLNGVTRDTVGWYSYFTGGFEFKNFFLFEHHYNPTATYKITVTGDICKVGVMTMGTSFDIGCALFGASMGFYDYSKKETDDWGETYLKQGEYRDYFRGEIAADTGKLPIIRKKLISRRGKLSLFIPTESYEMSIYGFLREPEMIFENPVKSIYTLDIEGVI